MLHLLDVISSAKVADSDDMQLRGSRRDESDVDPENVDILPAKNWDWMVIRPKFKLPGELIFSFIFHFVLDDDSQQFFAGNWNHQPETALWPAKTVVYTV